MNALPDQPAPAELAPPPSVSGSARLIRRIHMFTGLFLAPWMLMYAFSTLVMTHHDFVHSLYASESPAMEVERELDYSRSFPTNAARDDVGLQVLKDLGLDGTHSFGGGRNGKPLIINRLHALRPQRIVYDPSKGKIVIQRQQYRSSTFLERMHRRRGYNSYKVENVWGFIVDAAVVTMVFWSLSGIWLSWEVKAARRWSVIALAGGAALYALFAVMI